MDCLGFCNKCKQWLVLTLDPARSTVSAMPETRYSPASHALPNHDTPEGEPCINSGYSIWGLKYRVTSLEDAMKLAKTISEDNSYCLSSSSGGHSLACGDGDYCEEERKRRAQALADFVLNTELLK